MIRLPPTASERRRGGRPRPRHASCKTMEEQIMEMEKPLHAKFSLTYSHRAFDGADYFNVWFVPAPGSPRQLCGLLRIDIKFNGLCVERPPELAGRGYAFVMAWLMDKRRLLEAIRDALPNSNPNPKSA